MTNKQMALCNGIIHSASLTAGAAGGGMAQAACASGAAMTVGRTAAQVLCGWVLGIGNAVNAGTAFTITEAIGWILARQFDNQSCSLKQA